MNKSQDPFKDLNKELVAEQPGLGVSLAGLALVLLFGFGLRFLCQSDRYLELVENATRQIDPRVQAHVGTVELSLADGMLPELAVVIKNIEAESSETCWMRPSLEVDEVKLPLDFFKLLQGQISLHEIQAGEVSISLRSDLSQCEEKSKTAQFEPPGSHQVPRTLAQVVTEKSTNANDIWETWKSSQNAIDHIEIRRLRVHYLPVLFTSIELRQFSLDVNSQSPKDIQAAGLLSLAGETLSGDYASTAAIKFQFSERNEAVFKMAMDGHWREGHYQMDAEFKPRLREVKLDFDMNQIPLNQLLPLLRKYKLITSDFNGKQNWISLAAHMKGLKNGNQWPPLQISHAKLEGAIGEIEGQNIEVSTDVQPFDLEVRSLRMDSLLQFLGENRRHPVFGKLGNFHGHYHFDNKDTMSLKGELSGLEFIFSSRGQRQAQALSLVSAEGSLAQNKINIHLDQIRPSEGLFLGDVHLSADPALNRVTAKVRIDDMSLSPNVQKLITNGGGIGSFTGDLILGLENGLFSEIKGSLELADLVVERFSLKHGKAHFATTEGETSMIFKGQGVQIPEGSEPYKFLSSMTESNSSHSLDYTTANVTLKTHRLSDLRWADLSLQSPNEQLSSQGGWSPEGQLYGEIITKSKTQHSKYKLSGVRDRPVVTKN